MLVVAVVVVVLNVIDESGLRANGNRRHAVGEIKNKMRECVNCVSV